MKKILVPSDFSEQAQHAFKFAVEFAAQAKGQVHLMHVIELPVLYDTTLMPALSFEKEYLEDAAGLAKKTFTAQIKKVAKKVSVTWSVDYGNPTSVILQEMKKNKYDLVVMGTKGATGLKEYFVGSNTEKIVRHSGVPVIAVPGPVQLSSVKNLVVATSLSGNQDSFMAAVKKLQEFFKASLHLVYVNTPAMFRRDSESTQLLNSFSKRYALERVKLDVINDITEEEGLMNYALKTGKCMVVMATHGRRGLAHLLTGSVAEDVVNHIKFPVYTLRMGKASK
jgi:nucleotide-binding universal stress UspA family protein